MKNTKHFSLDRNDRNDFIKKYIGYGNIVKTFTVDRGHKNGAEWHTVTSTGLIIVQNARTHRLVTILIARPNQIKRLYENKGLTAPGYLMDLARKHQEYGYNNLQLAGGRPLTILNKYIIIKISNKERYLKMEKVLIIRTTENTWEEIQYDSSFSGCSYNNEIDFDTNEVIGAICTTTPEYHTNVLRGKYDIEPTEISVETFYHIGYDSLL